MIMPITLTIAGAAALLHIWLSIRVSQLRLWKLRLIQEHNPEWRDLFDDLNA